VAVAAIAIFTIRDLSVGTEKIHRVAALKQQR